MTDPALVWFRNDLRLADNPAIAAAVKTDAPVVALYILDDAAAGDWRRGGASRWWLHHSLDALAADLGARGVTLIFRRGMAASILDDVIGRTGAKSVFWNRLYEPWAIRRDGEIKASLRERGLTVESFNGALLFEPAKMRNKQGGPFRVFTPFWKACLAAPEPDPPSAAPKKLRGAPALEGDRLEDWRLLPKKPDWARGLRESWRPGEAAAIKRLAAFAKHGAADYGETRNAVAEEGVSRLSPHLHFGEISPRQAWCAVTAAAGDAGLPFLREIGWREFCHHLLVASPQMPDAPLDARFSGFPWRHDGAAFDAWTKGLTGYPMVDAGMRQLWTTGWMHNRARMIAASFLIKHLLLPWRDGEKWFWDTLVDADLANNSGGWQWVAGSGADAAPYFRVFNPVLQGEKFDPQGEYVRRWVPELRLLSNDHIHKPWEAPPAALAFAGIVLGKTYPLPMVDHASARARALAAFEATRAQ